MILIHTCAVCGWPRLGEAQRSRSGSTSFEICPCCGFEPGFTEEAPRVRTTIEDWRRRWLEHGMVFKHTHGGLPPQAGTPSIS